MKKSLCLLSGLLLLTGLGCSSTKASHYSSTLNSDVKSKLKADIEVGEKISGSASIKKLFGFFVISAPEKYAASIDYNSYPGKEFDFSSRLYPGNYFPACILPHCLFAGCIFPDIYSSELVTSAAAYDAISKSGADVLVAPRYEIEYVNHIFTSEVRATVVGYKGKIKGIKTIEKEETEANLDVEVKEKEK